MLRAQLAACIAAVTVLSSANADTPWKRYVIDDELRGADGVKLADANGDGRVDIVTGWEESGRVRAYFHPGSDLATQLWPRVDVGLAPSVEDAIWVDLNGDGFLDVLSSCEGKEQSIRMHFSPVDRTRLLESEAWRTEILPCSIKQSRWMFAAILLSGSDEEQDANIVLASKNPNGQIAILKRRGSDPRDWEIEKLTEANWVMSVFCVDVDGDGHCDILYDDRKSVASGIFWLRNPGAAAHGVWERRRLGPAGREVMFMSLKKERARLTVFAAVKPHEIWKLTNNKEGEASDTWNHQTIQISPTDLVGNAKAVAVADLDGNGTEEFVLSFESAVPPKSGVVMMKRQDEEWQLLDVSGPEGIKFDLLELADIDLDGDLDILTCEERHNKKGLGIVWYANPKF